MTPKEFYDKYKAFADEAAQGTTVFPDTILAVALLESAYGKSVLAEKYNNFFGVKADPSWAGNKVTLPTHEEIHGKMILVNADFRVYPTPKESFANYVHFISGPRYVKAGVLGAKSSSIQFEALHEAGYATDSQYANKLRNVLKLMGINPETNKPIVPVIDVPVVETPVVKPPVPEPPVVKINPHIIKRHYTISNKKGQTIGVDLVITATEAVGLEFTEMPDSISLNVL